MNYFKNIILVLVFIMLLGSNHVMAKETVFLDGGLLVDGSTLVPMRSVFENLGAKVRWNSSDQSITVTKDDTKIFMKVNDINVKLNDKTINLDVPPKIKKGNTIIPLRFVSEAIGAKVRWDGRKSRAVVSTDEKEIYINVKQDEIIITISAAGDVTLGGDDRYGYHGSFNQEAKQNGNGFFVENIKDIFAADDLTMVNLETTLTKATARANKQFTFKGDPSYTEILKLGGIETVNLANNHTFDFLQKGYDDTIKNLKDASVGYFGYENYHITEVEDVKIGLLGYKGWNDTSIIRKQIKEDIQTLKGKEGVSIVIVNFHWGQERSYVPNQSQKSLGRYTIDSGADLVIGHHPHVVQGIEEYKDKFIVYSLGNFMFGGNRNPSDKDTFVFQQTFHLKSGKLTDEKEIKVIPFSISSVSNRNNFQPTPLKGSAAKTLKDKLIRLSKGINNTNWLQYEK